VQEGLRIPPVRLTAELARIFAANSRSPLERSGDLDAQAGANRVGVTRLYALVASAGAGSLDQIVDYGHRRMNAALGSVPDGSWAFDDVLDAAGGARVAVRVTKRRGEIEFDFTGTAAQVPGNVNAVLAVTVSAVSWALRSVTDPTIPANGGALRPVRVVAPPGTVVSAVPPAAVGAGNVEVSQRVADVCLGALAQAVPERVPAAGQGTMNNVMVGGRDWVYYETVGGGQGGRPGPPGVPGQSGIHTGMTNTRNTPIEALERAYPLRVLRCAIRRGSGGRGAAAGGDGIIRDLQVLEDCTVSLVTERRVSQPWGLAGGDPGLSGQNWLLPQGDEGRAEQLPPKVTVLLQAGDVIRMLTPGGGGWGRPPV
jgi:N-methylhydantoinase B/oxoprolinase/acetone carboxylase alpha subunit